RIEKKHKKGSRGERREADQLIRARTAGCSFWMWELHVYQSTMQECRPLESTHYRSVADMLVVCVLETASRRARGRGLRCRRRERGLFAERATSCGARGYHDTRPALRAKPRWGCILQKARGRVVIGPEFFAMRA